MSLRKYDPSYDRAMLLAEIRRLQREKRLVFAGETLEAQLGADRWILGSAVVEEKKPRRKRGALMEIERELLEA